MANGTFITFLLILIAPAMGSFLAVLVDRLPRAEPIGLAPSRCRSCGIRLRPGDLIPLLSFAIRRGRCGMCGAAIPPFTLYMELLATGAAVLAVLAGGSAAQCALAAIWLWLLLTLAVTDMIWMRLPDPLTLAVFGVAIGMAALPTGIGLSAALWGAVLGTGSFAVLRWAYEILRGRPGLGLGDVKLMAGLGAFAGPLALPYLVLMAACAALATAILTRNTSSGGLDGARALPFGTALCGAAAVMWLLRVSG